MGKANRIKAEKAKNVLSAPAKKKAANSQKRLPTWVSTLILVLALLLLAGTATFFALDGNGVFTRKVFLKTKHYKVNTAMMAYMVNMEYQNLVNTYDNYSQTLGVTVSIPAGKGGTSLDKEKALQEQIYATKDEDGNELPKAVTWYEHFIELAVKDVKEMLAVCEAAHAAGHKLSKSEQDRIDEEIQYMETYAYYYYNRTLEGYITVAFGESMREKDLRAIMEIEALSKEYSSLVANDILNSVDKTQIDKEYTDNRDKYDTFVDFISNTFTATFTPSTNTDTTKAAEENAKNAKKYEELKTKYAAYTEELEKVAKENPENFGTKLLSILQEVYRAEEEDAALEAKKKAAAEGTTDVTLTEEEIQTCINTANDRATKALVSAVRQNMTTDNLPVNFKDWVTNKEDPKEKGDVYKDVSEYDVYGNKAGTAEADMKKEYTNATSSYAVYLLDTGLHAKSGDMHTVSHILFSKETYDGLESAEKLSGVKKTLAERVLAKHTKLTAELMAKELLLLMQEEDNLVTKVENGKTYYVMNAGVFEVYGQKYTDDSSITYENVYMGQMVKPFQDWLFDDARVGWDPVGGEKGGAYQIGEISYPAAIESEYGYHIMLYRGDKKVAKEYDVKMALAEGKYTAWLEEQVAATSFTDNSQNAEYVALIGA